MRKILLLLVLATTACATTASGPRPVNVYYVRQDIKSAIEAQPGDAGPRSIASMGSVTAERATVFTNTKEGRREETWVKGPSGWAMTEGKLVSTTAQ